MVSIPAKNVPHCRWPPSWAPCSWAFWWASWSPWVWVWSSSSMNQLDLRSPSCGEFLVPPSIGIWNKKAVELLFRVSESEFLLDGRWACWVVFFLVFVYVVLNVIWFLLEMLGNLWVCVYSIHVTVQVYRFVSKWTLLNYDAYYAMAYWCYCQLVLHNTCPLMCILLRFEMLET